ncbi:hypothetical protein Clacol_004998 [Clathrus columnatus]|uniref:Aspartokinase n=1 Tax=Clathrus columnatus TaxID=1419009 RepID=A0AAV5A8X7_9AGAM|nr:hypothetical protein Clacol_004998 [Clathrus columnatus]
MSPKANLKWLVQKFGGTSVGKFDVKIAEDIVSAYLDQYRVVVVCSARSSSTKALGTTNLLLRAVNEALSRPQAQGAITTSSLPSAQTVNGLSTRNYLPSPNLFSTVDPYSSSVPFNATVDLLKSEHITAAKQSLKDPILLESIINEIEHDCEGLRQFLYAAQIINEISPRSKDSIVGVGERLSCKLMAAILKDRGIDSEFVSLENIIPEAFGDPDSMTTTGILGQSFYDRLCILFAERIRQCEDRVPVVTGFFGPVPGSVLKQIGRGYTDVLAALLAAGLQASELQIWKEVDGVFTADPHKVSTARLIPIISPDEAAELTYYGSEVVHPLTMRQAISKKIPIRIKNVKEPNGQGTIIRPDPSQIIDLEAMVQSGASLSTLKTAATELEELKRVKRLPTAVTIKKNILVLNVNSNRKHVSHTFLAGVFNTLDKFGVIADLISTSEVHVGIATEAGDISKKELVQLIHELERIGTVSIFDDMAILSLVGHQMSHRVGIAGRMFTTLAEGNINIEMISQGASEINVSCVIQARYADKALSLIHQSCLQIKPEGVPGRRVGM